MRAWEASVGRQAVPIVAMSGDDLLSNKEACLACGQNAQPRPRNCLFVLYVGMTEFVLKPIKLVELTALLNRLLPITMNCSR